VRDSVRYTVDLFVLNEDSVFCMFVTSLWLTYCFQSVQ